MTEPVTLISGDAPVILAFPHSRTFLPPELLSRFNERGQAMGDTDRHVDRLYEDLLPGATRIHANFSRYVIDANRAPSGQSLYPGQNTTGLCPLTDFSGAPLYHPGEEPDPEEIAARIDRYHAPYHAAIAAEIARLRALHPHVLLYDCHSIRGTLPFLFEGTLPDLNLGTNGGAACASDIEAAARATCEAQSDWSFILNGRFRGGWTTRHYGQPETGVSAFQMELAQHTYMDEAQTDEYNASRAQPLRDFLKFLLATLEKTVRHLPPPA